MGVCSLRCNVTRACDNFFFTTCSLWRRMTFVGDCWNWCEAEEVEGAWLAYVWKFGRQHWLLLLVTLLPVCRTSLRRLLCSGLGGFGTLNIVGIAHQIKLEHEIFMNCDCSKCREHKRKCLLSSSALFFSSDFVRQFVTHCLHLHKNTCLQM